MDFSPRQNWGVFGTANNELWCIDPEGKRDWNIKVEESIRDIKIIEGRKKIILLLQNGHLVCLEKNGNLEFDTEVGINVTGLEVRSNEILAWSWNDKIIKLDTNGKLKGEIQVPVPLSFLKTVPKTGEIFVVQENMTLSMCDPEGTIHFSFNLPSPIERPNSLLPNIDVGYSGERVALAAYEKGLLLFYKETQTLGKVDIENPVEGVSLSRNGEKILLLDAMSRILLIGRDLEVEFEKKFDSEVLFARLDQKGERAFILDKAGTLACYEFLPVDRGREHFLEVKDYRNVEKKSAVWKASSKDIPEGPGQYLKVSKNGETLLFGDGKNLIAFDAIGNQILRKSFLQPFDQFKLSDDGKFVHLFNSEELKIIGLFTGEEKFLDYYGVGLKSYNSAPDASAILVLKKNSTLCLYSGQGDLIWERLIKGSVDKIQVSEGGSHSVFRANGTAIGYLNLKSIQSSSKILDEEISHLRIHGNQLIALTDQGICYATDLSGGVNWSFEAGANFNSITVFGTHLVLTGSDGELLCLTSEGKLKGEGKVHQARSRLNYFSECLLEVYFKNNTLYCYNVLSDDLLWKFHLDSSIELFDLHEMGNRVAVKTEEMIYYYYITSSPDLMDERTNFLEF